MQAERLASGREIWRVGTTVRRPVAASTPAVHALLRHLEGVGFEGSPRVLGIDDKGREVLTFVDGVEGRHVPHEPRTLRAVGSLIRQFHQAVEGFRPPADASWHKEPPPGLGVGVGAAATICHNDLAPYNTIYVEGRPVAFIDWDLAGPAPLLADVAHAAWTFVPLYTDDDCRRVGRPPEPRGPRLREFCDGYGVEGRDTFLDVVRAHLCTLPSPFAQRSVPFLDSARQEWEAQLS